MWFGKLIFCYPFELRGLELLRSLIIKGNSSIKDTKTLEEIYYTYGISNHRQALLLKAEKYIYTRAFALITMKFLGNCRGQEYMGTR